MCSVLLGSFFILKGRFLEVTKDFKRRHSVIIKCPRCEKRLVVTEWTTSLVCSCKQELDSLDILFECATQVYIPQAIVSPRPVHV